MLLASYTVLFLHEASSTSSVRKTEVIRVRLPFVKISRRKRLSTPIPYYHKSTSAQRFILSGDIKLNLKGKSQRKPSQAETCKTCNKTIRTNTKRLLCIYCKNETHLSCSSSYEIMITDSRTPAI